MRYFPPPAGEIDPYHARVPYSSYLKHKNGKRGKTATRLRSTQRFAQRMGGTDGTLDLRMQGVGSPNRPPQKDAKNKRKKAETDLHVRGNIH